jgi:signal transduction histidine kinase
VQDALVMGDRVPSRHHGPQQATYSALDVAQRQASLFRALHELAVAVAGMTEVATLARTIVNHASALTGAEAGTLYLLNSERDALVTAVEVGQPLVLSMAVESILTQTVAPGAGATGRAFTQRAPLVVDDYATWTGAIPAVRATGLKSLVSVPLLFADRVLGCLTLGFFAAHACDDEMVRSLQLLAAQVAPAFEALHLVEVYTRSELVLSATLEQKVIDRTTQLEAAVRELEAFSYSVSHDLRAPLRSVSSYSQILLRDYNADLPADAQDCLQRVTSAAQRMGQLIDDLLKFSRLGRHPLARRSVSMARLATEVFDEFTTERADRDITFEVADLPPCDGDSGLLRQVFANLFDNALKYSRSRAVAHIAVGFTVSEDDEIVYSVTDNGVGFDMQYVDKLFGVFQRLHRSQEYEGTGVGLANVQRIIHRHGGRIWADAAVDRGAAFFFTIGKDQADAG